MEVASDYNKDIATMRLKEFPALAGVTYLDHAGTTLVSGSQLEAHHRDISSNIYGNPHSRSPSSQLTTDTIDQIRYRILQFFNTSPDDYTVIFTAGCTGALKLVAECFDFHGNSISSCRSNRVKNEVSSVKDTPKISGESSETEKHICDESHGDKHDKKRGSGENQFSCHGNGDVNENGDSNYKKGSFIYLLDNHTSVQGMREPAFTRAGRVTCVDCDKDGIISKEHVLYQTAQYRTDGNSLFAYPAQSNFSGQKYPMEWISEVQNGHLGRMTLVEGHCYVLLDAACLVSTSPLDLGRYKPDFVTLSFYKIFGYPTGLGALLVLNSSSHLLRKTYYGGGTVSVSLSSQRFHVLRPALADRFEDGTVSFLDILALRHGFQALDRLAGGISAISDHTFTVAKYFYRTLKSLRHRNGASLAEIYCHGNYEDQRRQGAIVTFNLIRANGEYIGFSEVDKLAQLHNVHVRTGCFCNLGACQKFLNISDEELKNNFDAGHVCGDDQDLIDGKPTGAIRVSFGYMSTLEDAQKCLQFIIDCFLEAAEKPVFFVKSIENQSSEDIKNQSRYVMFSDVSVNQSVSDSVSHVNNNAQSVKSEDSDFVAESKPPPSVDTKTKVPKNIPNAIENSSKLTIYGLSDGSVGEVQKSGLGFDSSADDQSKLVGGPGRRLTDIFLYPIKSCAAFKVDKWPLSSRGLLHDREWMIVADTGITLGQKREPRLCLVEPAVDLDLQMLVLNYPGMKPVSIPLVCEKKKIRETSLCNSKVCGDRVTSIDCGDEVSDWLSEVLGRPGTRLIRQNPDNVRTSKLKQSENGGDTSSRLSLANESQYLMLSLPSIDVLRDKIRERCEAGESSELIDSQNLLLRFRGNLVVGGGEPLEEESWKSLHIGNVTFKSQGACTRCQMVCFDPTTGERSKEPLKTLAVWRERKLIHIFVYSSGIVGQSWSIVFSTRGYHVNIYDNDTNRLSQGLEAIRSKMLDLESKDALRGTLSAADAFKLLSPKSSLQECVGEARYIQECVFEDFHLKHRLFLEMENYIPENAIMASSSGQMFASRLSEGLKRKTRLVVVHPLNPPHLVPLVEIIPAPWTDPEVISTTRQLMEDVGQEPVVAKKETQGFIICRVQHAITAECFKLIRNLINSTTIVEDMHAGAIRKDDVISVNDLDKLMPAGLGLRYAFLGALETSYLNANGMVDFCRRYGEDIYRQQVESGGPIALEGDTLRKIQQEIEKRIPMDKIEERRKWRDDRLTEIFRLKQQEKKSAKQ